jgi:hypothetical protein
MRTDRDPKLGLDYAVLAIQTGILAVKAATPSHATWHRSGEWILLSTGRLMS